MRTEFLPQKRTFVDDELLTEEAAEKFAEAPLCECGSKKCKATFLPKEAWLYCGLEGQFVVAPGHSAEYGARAFDMQGFTIYEWVDSTAQV